MRKGKFVGVGGGAGDSAYLYIAWASAADGTGFTMVFDPALKYIAVKTTTEPIAAPVVGDFAGLWVKYVGENGQPGYTPQKGVDYFDGDDGYTPYIQGGYWYINGVNTGVTAIGANGKNTEMSVQAGYICWRLVGDADWIQLVSIASLKGDPGAAGRGITSVTLVSTVGKVKTYRITFTDNLTFDYEVTDGADGTGGGGATNLSYTPDPAKGTVHSSSGDDTDLPLVNHTNAGLMSPGMFDKLDGITTDENGNVIVDPNQELGIPVVYGRLFNPYVVYDSRGFCPSGWEFTNTLDWYKMRLYYPTTNINNVCKEIGTEHWNQTTADVTNEFKLNIRGSGWRDHNGGYSWQKIHNLMLCIGEQHPYGTMQSSSSGGSQGLASGIDATGMKWGYSVRLCKRNTTLLHGQVSTMIGNDGKIYPTVGVRIDANTIIEIMACDSSETRWKNGETIQVVSDSATWISNGNAGIAQSCIYDNLTENAGGQTTIQSQIDSLLKNQVEGDSQIRTRVSTLEGHEKLFDVYLDFLDTTVYVYNCPVAMKVTQVLYESVNPTLSIAINSNMTQYQKLTITPGAAGMVTLKCTEL